MTEETPPAARSRGHAAAEDVAVIAGDGDVIDAAARTLGADVDAETEATLSGPTPPQIADFVVFGRLGSGGMGVVYAAYDVTLDRKVAVKLLHREYAEESVGTGRLLREAKAMAQISHPNVAPIYEVGEHHGRIYVAMELIEGPTLRAWQDAEPRAHAAILDLYIQAGRGLQAAHAAGIVHRDFKPDNVLVGGDGRVRVVDFGLARAQGSALEPTIAEGGEAPTISEVTRACVGTPAYMSPEQFKGVAIDARSDIFAFSVALYEAIVGERPFAGEGLLALMANVIAGEMRAPAADSEAPAALLAALRRGLDPDPERRWSSMAELLIVLERIRGGDPSAAPRLRRRATLAILISTVVVTGFLNYRAFADRSAVSHAELVGAVLTGVVLVAGIGVFARKTLASNAYHRRVYLLLVVIVLQLLVFRLVAALWGLSLTGTYLLDLLGIAAVTGSAAVFALPWFGWLTVTTFAGAVAMLLIPEHALIAYNLGYSGSVLLLIVLWTRAAAARSRSG